MKTPDQIEQISATSGRKKSLKGNITSGEVHSVRRCREAIALVSHWTLGVEMDLDSLMLKLPLMLIPWPWSEQLGAISSIFGAAN